MTQHPVRALLITLALLNAGCDGEPLPERGAATEPGEGRPPVIAADNAPGGLLKVAQSAAPATAAVLEVEWEELIPPHWRADPALVELYQKGEIGDDDPRVIETRQRLEEPMAPANPALDGKRIRLAGLVVPLEMGKRRVTEFLLVPYHGACIHVPPPPTNQTVLVKTGAEGFEVRELFDAVWVTGTLKIEQSESEVAISGYTLVADEVKPYDEAAELPNPGDGR